jgi:hypothetical protein
MVYRIYGITRDIFFALLGKKGKPSIPRLPLFEIDLAALEQSVLLDQMFWLVFNDGLSLRSISVALVLRNNGGDRAVGGKSVPLHCSSI